MTTAPEQLSQSDTVSIAADIVAAYVSNNPLPVGELPKLIGDIHAALQGLGTPVTEPVAKQEPAVSVRKSVTPDFIICLEDGKKFKSLKRHLQHFNLTPDAYRQKWNLPSDYPMVAPNYAATRSALAKSIVLGRKAAPPTPAAAEKPKRVARAAAATTTTAASIKSPLKKKKKARKAPAIA